MRKCSRLSGLLLCILTLCVCSCGGGGSAADPMGTGTVQFVDESGSVITSATVQPGGSITLIAQVTNLRSDGTAAPVVNEKVSFSMVTAANGGGVAVVNDRTASGGQAMAVYTAGNNMASDTVRVTTAVGSNATITITKQGGVIGPRISTPTATPPTLAANQTTVIAAKVTDENNNPKSGETILFTLPTNASGGSFINNAGGSVSTLSVNTDAAGNAIIVYRAGTDSAHLTVTDTIRASLPNGSSSAVIVTRTGPTGITITLSAKPTSVSPGETTIITATISSTPPGEFEEMITFTIPVNNSGGYFIDASGNTSTVVTVPVRFSGTYTINYKPGTALAGTVVEDTVEGTLLNAESSAVIVPRDI